MSDSKHYHAAGASFAGAFWFSGWLFTIGFLPMVWWKILFSIVIWPFYLGQHFK